MDPKNNKSYSLFNVGDNLNNNNSQYDINIGNIDINTNNNLNKSKSGNETRIEDKLYPDNQSFIAEEEDVIDKLAEIEELNELKNKIPKYADIHDKDISVVYRCFVELILVVADFKFNNPRLDKSLQLLFDK